jgi:hypothetical protein
VLPSEAAGRQLLGRLFAEPLLTGPLFSAETLSWQGRTVLLGITGRLLSRRWLGREELASFPALPPDSDLAVLGDRVARVLDAVGHSRGFAHVEFALTAHGPELVEVNARIGGLVGEAMCRALPGPGTRGAGGRVHPVRGVRARRRHRHGLPAGPAPPSAARVSGACPRTRSASPCSTRRWTC